MEYGTYGPRRADCWGSGRLSGLNISMSAFMNAALYLELVDAVARIDGSAQLKVVADRVAATPMHPLERRVLDRALRARSEALVIRRQLLTPDIPVLSVPEPSSFVSPG